MTDLREQVIRLAYENPELRGDLLPLLRESRLKAFTKYVVVDVRTPGGKWLESPQRFYDKASDADKAAEKLAKKLRVDPSQIQVIDAAWYTPAAEAWEKEKGNKQARSTDPADKSYDLISQHESLVKFLQKKLDELGKTMQRVNRDVQGADIYGGKHLAALDLMKRQAIPALERFRAEVDMIVKQAEQATK